MKAMNDIKTNTSFDELPKFRFVTERPMRSLFIVKDDLDVESKESRVTQIQKDDGRVGDGKKRVRLTASSDATDLIGDVMSKNALQKMKEAAVGTTIFLNHDPIVPESVFGSVEKAELVTRKIQYIDGATGKEVTIGLVCLDYDIIVEETNERAVKTYEIIDAGTTKLGASVTIAIVTTSKMSGGRRSIDDVIYLETSIVGIPCNQTAWVQYAKSSGWVRQARKSLRFLDSPSEIEEYPFDIDSLELPVNSITLPNPGVVVENQKGITTKDKERIGQWITSKANVTKEKKMRIREAKNSGEVLEAFNEAFVTRKDLFSDTVDEHFENPWLYCMLFEDSLIELIYWNTSMPTDEKLAALKEMLAAFSTKMAEVMSLYWTEDDSEEKAAFLDSFNKAASKQLDQVITKIGRRNNSEDQKTIQTCHDMLKSIGAECQAEKAALASAEGAELQEKVAEVEITDESDKQASTDTAVAEIALLKEELATSKANEASLQEKIQVLENEKKTLELSAQEWKAAADTGVKLLEFYGNLPAPRPGQRA
jgi:hypothetical protein